MLPLHSRNVDCLPTPLHFKLGPELQSRVGLRTSFRRRIAPVSGHHPHSLGKAGTSPLQAISQPKAGRGRAAHRDEPHIILPKLISTHHPLSLTEYADLLHQYHHTSSSDSLCDTYVLNIFLCKPIGIFPSQMPGTASSAGHETLSRSGLQLLQDDQRGLFLRPPNQQQNSNPFPLPPSQIPPEAAAGVLEKRNP